MCLALGGRENYGARGGRAWVASGVKPGGQQFPFAPEFHSPPLSHPWEMEQSQEVSSRHALCSPCIVLRLKAPFPSSGTCFWNPSCFRTPPEPSLEDGGRWEAVGMAHDYQANIKEHRVPGKMQDSSCKREPTPFQAVLRWCTYPGAPRAPTSARVCREGASGLQVRAAEPPPRPRAVCRVCTIYLLFFQWTSSSFCAFFPASS